MKTLVSFLLGGVMLFGAATLGLQSASVSAQNKDDKNYKHDKHYRKHHRRHHRRHRRHEHRMNKLSY
jgi:hypothetical protein